MEINLDQIQRFGADPEAMRVSFAVLDGTQEHSLSCSLTGLATLVSAAFQASQHLVKLSGIEPELPEIPVTAVMRPSQLDVRRQPKSDGSVVFQAGATALEVKLDSLALDFLTQLLNSRR